MYDILIKNGNIVDGTGEPKYRADVAINDGVIVSIGDLSGDSSKKEIDATDKIVSPGFIDISNRSDTRWRLFKDPGLESLLHQGITTIIGGNSGASLAPIYNDEMLSSIRKWIDISDVNINWQTVSDFLEVIERHGLAVNFGTFVGYGTLRRGVVGDEERDLTKEEKASIKKHIEEGLKQGALGVSTGLIYSHERNIKTEELIELAKIVAKNKKMYVAHLRDEGSKILESIDEVIHIQNQTNVNMHVSHLKVTKKSNWTDMIIAIKNIEKTSIIFDIYPYIFSTTVLYTLLPNWVSDGGRRMLLERLRNKNLRARVVDEMNDGVDLSKAIVSHTMRSDYFCGKTFEQIAKNQETDINNAVIDVLLASDGQANIFLDSISLENIKRGLKSKSSVISSNGIGYTIQKRNNCIEHPRSFGAFAKIFEQYVDNVIDIESAVYKSTWKIAQSLGIDDRGIIKEGKVADIIVFDDKNMKDNSTVEMPYKYATGVIDMIINGQVVLKYGKYTGIRSGAIIK